MGYRYSNCSHSNPNDKIHLKNDEVMVTAVHDVEHDCRWEMPGTDLRQVEGMVLNINGECSGKYVVGNDEWQIPTLNNTVSSCIAFYHYNRTNSCGNLESTWKKGCWPQVVYNDYTLTFTPNLYSVNNFTVMYEPLSCSNVSSNARSGTQNWTSFGLLLGIIILSFLMIALTVITQKQRNKNRQIKEQLMQQNTQHEAIPHITVQSQSYENCSTEGEENRTTTVLTEEDGYESPVHLYTEATIVHDRPGQEYEVMSCL